MSIKQRLILYDYKHDVIPVMLVLIIAKYQYHLRQELF